jgi:unsaturated chondroitin disaccharide hydrolase
MNIRNITLALLLLSLAACNTSQRSALEVAADALKYCDQQVHRTLAELQEEAGGNLLHYNLMPRNIPDSMTRWTLRDAYSPEEWCSGFWPGILWYDYENTQDRYIKQQAEQYTATLGYLSRRPAFDHDLGFLIFCSYGNGYRLTHNPAYKQVIFDTADTLATLFNPRVGALLSWPRLVNRLGGHNVIMDNMMNLEMLMWASKNGGNPHLAEIAVSHADRTMENQFRPDYTSYHVAIYDSLTGEFIKGITFQGYSDKSMWARGQAWAIYGFTMMYRETNDRRYLDFVQKVADAYLSRLPEDYIPYWDFDAPDIPHAPRDASSACITASALLELCTYLPGTKGDAYRTAAEKMLQSLNTKQYRSGTAKPSFLLHSVGHLPIDMEEVDASVIYADYYYIEALTRWKKLLSGISGS